MRNRIVRGGMGLVWGAVLGLVASFVFSTTASAIDAASSSTAIHNTLDHFDSSVQELKDERDALRQEIDSLKDEQETMIDGVKSRLDMNEDQNQASQDELVAARAKIAALEKEKKALADQGVARNVVVEDYADVKSEQRYVDAENALAKTAVEVQKLAEDKERLKAQIDDLREQQQKILEARDQNKTSTEREAKAKIAKLEADNKAFEKKILKLQNDQEDLAAKNKELSARADNGKAAKLESEKKALEKKILKLQSDQEDLTAKNQELSARVNDSKAGNFEAEKKALENKILKLQKDQDALVAKNQEISARSEEAITGWMEKARDAEEKLALSKKDASGEKAKADLKAKEVELSGLWHALLSAQQDLASTQAAMRKSEDINTQDRLNFKSQIQGLEAKVQDLTLSLKASDQKLAQSESELKAARADILTSKSAQQEYTNRLQKDHKDELAKVQDAAKQALDKNKSLEDSVRSHENQVVELQTQLKDSRDLTALVRSQLQAEQDKSAKAKVEYDAGLLKLKNDSDATVARAQNDILASEKKATEIQGELRDTKDILAGVRAQLQVEQDKSAKMRNDQDAAYQKLKIDYDGFIAKSQAESQLAQDKIKSLTDEKKKLTDENATRTQVYETKIADLERRVAESSKKALDAAAQVNVVEDLLAKEKNGQADIAKYYENRLATAVSSVNQGQDKINTLNVEKDALSKKVDLLSNQILAANVALSKNAGLEKDNKSLKSGMDNLAKMMSDTEAKYKDLLSNHETEKAHWQSLEKEYQDNLAVIKQTKATQEENVLLQNRLKNTESKLKKLLDDFVKMQDENDRLKQTAKSHINPTEFKETMERNSQLEKENTTLRAETRGQAQSLLALKDEKEVVSGEDKILKQKLARMEDQLKKWDADKQEWEQAKAKFQTKDQKMGAVSDDYRRVVAENERLRQQVDVFPKDLTTVNSKIEKLAQENALLHYNLGVIYTEKEIYPEAVKEFEKALDLKPDDAFSHYNLGIIYSQYMIDEEKAMDHFKKYLKLAPHDKDSDMARKYIFVRETYDAEKK